MLYVLSDIHGHYEAYRAILEAIRFSSRDVLYVLGDVIDRGPDGIRILQDMMVRPNVVPILGNHELTAAACLSWLLGEITEESLAALGQAQLAALQEKLTEAEARSQRALSMAQQTRSGHVYVISNVGSFGEDVFKIGMTRRLEPLDRVRELGDASVPFAFDVHAMIYSEDAPALENALHRKFNELRLNKVNPRKEFFRVNLGDIRAATQEMGLTAQFTMLAQAQEYRESLAMANLPKEELERRMQGLLREEEENGRTLAAAGEEPADD